MTKEEEALEDEMAELNKQMAQKAARVKGLMADENVADLGAGDVAGGYDDVAGAALAAALGDHVAADDAGEVSDDEPEPESGAEDERKAAGKAKMAQMQLAKMQREMAETEKKLSKARANRHPQRSPLPPEPQHERQCGHHAAVNRGLWVATGHKARCGQCRQPGRSARQPQQQPRNPDECRCVRVEQPHRKVGRCHRCRTGGAGPPTVRAQFAGEERGAQPNPQHQPHHGGILSEVARKQPMDPGHRRANH